MWRVKNDQQFNACFGADLSCLLMLSSVITQLIFSMGNT
jgi:hypothetical protein